MGRMLSLIHISGKREDVAPAIQNQAASTTLGDIDALAALKEQMEAGATSSLLPVDFLDVYKRQG